MVSLFNSVVDPCTFDSISEVDKLIELIEVLPSSY